MRIDVLDLKCYYNVDGLYINDGYNNTARLLVRTCSMPADPFYQSSGNYMFLNMIIDGSSQGTGFQIHWGEYA